MMHIILNKTSAHHAPHMPPRIRRGIAKDPDHAIGVLVRMTPDRNQKPNLAAVSFSVSAERFSAASSRSDTGVLIREFTP